MIDDKKIEEAVTKLYNYGYSRNLVQLGSPSMTWRYVTVSKGECGLQDT